MGSHTCHVALYDRHSVGGQCAGLVRANRRRVTHRLAGVQMSHQVIVEHHFLHRTYMNDELVQPAACRSSWQ